jgi:hypothetical protein
VGLANGHPVNTRGRGKKKKKIVAAYEAAQA